MISLISSTISFPSYHSLPYFVHILLLCLEMECSLPTTLPLSLDSMTPACSWEDSKPTCSETAIVNQHCLHSHTWREALSEWCNEVVLRTSAHAKKKMEVIDKCLNDNWKLGANAAPGSSETTGSPLQHLQSLTLFLLAVRSHRVHINLPRHPMQ